MTRAQLEHVIRAAATIADDPEIVVIDSQAILGQFPAAPAELLTSVEAGVYPRRRPERADLIDGSIGELSPFHQTFGYYAHGVGEETAVLPDGWQARLVPVAAGEAVGLCLEVHDLVLSKYAGGRAKDREFARVALRNRLVDPKTLLERLPAMPLAFERRAAIQASIEEDTGRSPGQRLT